MTSFPRPPAELTALIDPNLQGAACAGHAPLFDARGRHERLLDAEDRHDQAIAICHTCPVLRRCGQALLDLPLSQREGIWAGVNAAHVTTTITEDREDTAA